jgi:16S rRNA (guanine527-N7)-methyltransferase
MTSSADDREMIPLPEGGAERLDAYEQLLTTRGADLGVVARSDLPRIRERHLLDCLRAVSAVRADDRAAVDLGSGGGLPGVVVAIACPQLVVTLAERRRNRGAFLELVVLELGLPNAKVAIGDVGALPPTADVCFARAFADAKGSWAAAETVLVPGGRLVYFAGAATGAQELPEDVGAQILPPAPFASGGPLVIMSRQ